MADGNEKDWSRMVIAAREARDAADRKVEQLQRELAAMTKLAEAADAVVSKLLKTADGVPLIPFVLTLLWCLKNLSDRNEGYVRVVGTIRRSVSNETGKEDWSFHDESSNTCRPLNVVFLNTRSNGE